MAPMKANAERKMRYTDDMFVMNDTDEELISQGISFDLKHIQSQWDFNVAELLNEANLSIPENTNVITGGSNGIHTEHLGHIICEMQYLQRAFHGVSW
jgi:ring-1,2-phenylacetyl-CoA epoxidase subunit PaaC